MTVRDRVRRYREVGGAADLVRVEVLLPAAKRDQIIEMAARLRQEHRKRRKQLDNLIGEAIDIYGVRILDNIDLNRVPDRTSKARVVASALMERGDGRAFVLARKILAEVEAG